MLSFKKEEEKPILVLGVECEMFTDEFGRDYVRPKNRSTSFQKILNENQAQKQKTNSNRHRKFYERQN